MEPHVADVGVRSGEDGGIIEREHRHVVEAHELGVLDLHGEGQDAEAIVSETEHRVSEHQAHNSRLRRRLDRLLSTMIWMERKGQRGQPLDFARERRERSDKALEAVNHQEAIVEEIWLRDLHASDEDLGVRSVVVLERLGGDGDTPARAQRLDLRTESQPPEIFDGEKSRDYVLSEEVWNGTREASPERRVGRSEEC